MTRPKITPNIVRFDGKPAGWTEEPVRERGVEMGRLLASPHKGDKVTAWVIIDGHWVEEKRFKVYEDARQWVKDTYKALTKKGDASQ